MSTPVLVACSHGTRSVAGRTAVRGLVDAVRRRLPPSYPVVETWVDVQEPALPEVLGGLTGRSAVVVPLLLSAGYHVHHDLASVIEPTPGFERAAPLGPDWNLAEIAAQRLLEAGVRPGDQIVMGASASSDERAIRDVGVAAELLSQLWGQHVEVGHVGHTGPRLADVVAAARERSAGRVVVSSYLLAPGHFQNKLHESGADLVTAPLIDGDPDRRLIDLVLERFSTAALRLRHAA